MRFSSIININLQEIYKNLREYLIFYGFKKFFQRKTERKMSNKWMRNKNPV